MATPTPGKQPAVAATPPVSTPFSQSHLTAFSPHAPRGSPRGFVVPSPQGVKKSPANFNTLYGGHQTNSSFGGAMAMNFDSPSAAAALGLGDMVMDLPLGVVRGEDDQKMKLGQIMDILKVNRGRITEEGLEGLAKRLGLDPLWETPRGGVITKRIVYAAERFAVEVNFCKDAIHSVKLEFFESNETVTKWQEKAAQIFFKDLEYAPGENPLTKMLDSFETNLERLAALEKLSVLPTLNCLEAVAGIYESLGRLYDWELARLKEQEGTGKDVDSLVRSVICKKSGRPVMHERKRVGLSVEYWQEKRLISTKSSTAESASPKTWAMVIECATVPPNYSDIPQEPYTRVRVSDAWISESILKSNPSPEDLMSTAAHNALLDWLEPDLTLVPATDASKADAVMQGMPLEAASQSKLPDVMFIAKFEPPIAIPNYIADWIYQIIRATPSLFPSITNVTYIDSLIIPYTPEENVFDQPRQVKRQIKVPVVTIDGKGGRKSSTKLHKNTLFVQKLEPGYELHELPFSHPRQLIEIMPVLRQYAFLSTLLKNSFGPSKTEKKTSAINSASSNMEISTKKNKKATNKKDDFLAFMQDASIDEGMGRGSDKVLNVDVTLNTESGGLMAMQSTFQAPRLGVHFPRGEGGRGFVVFEVGLNGVVSVFAENILPKVDEEGGDFVMGDGGGNGEEGARRRLGREDLARMLEVCEDLGVWVEFVGRRLG